jgi:hypothetical protein
VPLGLPVGVLHDVQVQLEGSLRVQAEQMLFSKQMAVRRSRRIEIGEQVAQQGQGVAQGLARIVGLTVGPQQGRQFAAGVHAPFDRQVEQQSLCLAQGKHEATAVMHLFGRAEHG